MWHASVGEHVQLPAGTILRMANIWLALLHCTAVCDMSCRPSSILPWSFPQKPGRNCEQPQAPASGVDAGPSTSRNSAQDQHSAAPNSIYTVWQCPLGQRCSTAGVETQSRATSSTVGINAVGESECQQQGGVLGLAAVCSRSIQGAHAAAAAAVAAATGAAASRVAADKKPSSQGSRSVLLPNLDSLSIHLGGKMCVSTNRPLHHEL